MYIGVFISCLYLMFYNNSYSDGVLLYTMWVPGGPKGVPMVSIITDFWGVRARMGARTGGANRSPNSGLNGRTNKRTSFFPPIPAVIRGKKSQTT